jgi:hypothetical protein
MLPDASIALIFLLLFLYPFSWIDCYVRFAEALEISNFFRRKEKCKCYHETIP